MGIKMYVFSFSQSQTLLPKIKAKYLLNSKYLRYFIEHFDINRLFIGRTNLIFYHIFKWFEITIKQGQDHIRCIAITVYS